MVKIYYSRHRYRIFRYQMARSARLQVRDVPNRFQVIRVFSIMFASNRLTVFISSHVMDCCLRYIPSQMSSRQTAPEKLI